MKNIKHCVLFILIAVGLLGQGHCDDIKIPEEIQLDRCLNLMINRLITEDNLQECGFNKKLADWSENDFELLRAALKNEVTINTKRYPTSSRNFYLKYVDKGIDRMKGIQLDGRQQLVKKRQRDEVLDKIQKLHARIEPFLKKANSSVFSPGAILSSNEISQIKAVEVEYLEIEAYAKQQDIYFMDSLGRDLEKIKEFQNEAVTFHAANEIEKQKLEHSQNIVFVAAIVSLLASILIYFSLDRRKVQRLQSKIELLSKLGDGSILAEENQLLNTKAKLRDSKWKSFKPEIIKHLIEEYNFIVAGDARATISELVALRIEDGVQNFQSFLPPSVRLPASHYAPFLFTEEDVERYKTEQKNIASLLEEQLEPDYENETLVWVNGGK